MLDVTRRVRAEAFIAFWERQVPLVQVTRRRRRRRRLTARRHKRASMTPARHKRPPMTPAERSRKSRRRLKLGLEPISLDLPWDVICSGWCAKENRPVDTPQHRLPLQRIKNELADILRVQAKRYLSKSSSLRDAVSVTISTQSRRRVSSEEEVVVAPRNQGYAGPHDEERRRAHQSELKMLQIRVDRLSEDIRDLALAHELTQMRALIKARALIDRDRAKRGLPSLAKVEQARKIKAKADAALHRTRHFK